MLIDEQTIGLATLYCGDSFEILPELGISGAIVTDPPYGINHSSNGQIFQSADPIAGDNSLQAYDWLDGLATPLIAFFSPYAWPGIAWRSVLCWHKGADVGAGGDARTCWKRDIELIGASRTGKLNGLRESALLQYRARQTLSSGHFCEKPVSLMNYLVNKLADPIIIDPFMGSGSTGVAAMNLRKRFIGIELERKWFDIACERIDQAQRQGDLFLPNSIAG